MDKDKRLYQLIGAYGRVQDAHKKMTGSHTAIKMKAPAFIFFLFMACAAYAGDQAPTIAGFTIEEALRLGEKMYLKGISPSGEPVEAIVQDDIPVDGTMFTCVSCHMRSGIGSIEGPVITLPTNGKSLFNPYTVETTSELFSSSYFRQKFRRPAYTDKSLGLALRTGIDPTGRTLDPVMPRYLLGDRDIEILVFYLKNLSNEISPGVTESTLRFATVFSDNIPPGEKEAMILPLEAFVRDRNSKADIRQKKIKSGRPLEEMEKSYRSLILDLWELKGPPDTWRSQLEAYNKKEPPFAVLGGMVQGDWSPVHQFCEQNRIPCILPVTGFPVVSETDWYTLFFSKGLFQEAEAAAKFLARSGNINDNTPVIQVFRDNREGIIMSAAFADSWKKLGGKQASEIRLGVSDKLTASFWEQLVAGQPDAVILLWLNKNDIASIEVLAGIQAKPRMVFVSAGLLSGEIYSLQEKIRSFVYITYPFRLPQDGRENIFADVASWLKIKKIPVTNISVSADIYFLGRLLSEVLMHMKRNFYRDYFLDVIDMTRDKTSVVANYPRLSFGPGQRYASKGCYIVQLTGGPKPELVKRSDWIIH